MVVITCLDLQWSIQYEFNNVLEKWRYSSSTTRLGRLRTDGRFVLTRGWNRSLLLVIRNITGESEPLPSLPPGYKGDTPCNLAVTQWRNEHYYYDTPITTSSYSSCVMQVQLMTLNSCWEVTFRKKSYVTAESFLEYQRNCFETHTDIRREQQQKQNQKSKTPISITRTDISATNPAQYFPYLI